MAEEKWVALVGSAPSSVRAAPYNDPRWDIYGCSPGVYGVAPRVTEWFELHLWEPGQQWFSPEYVQWLNALPARGVKLWVGTEDADKTVPGALSLPAKEIIEEFDPDRFFCTSSLFWMMAMAIRAGATKIGLWGVDMAASEEYEIQRSGCHYMSYIAKSRGIEVGVPQESDLFTPRFMYGIDEWTHAYRKARIRRSELTGRLQEAEQQQQQARDHAFFLKGALDDLKYFSETWSTKGMYTGPKGLPPAA